MHNRKRGYLALFILLTVTVGLTACGDNKDIMVPAYHLSDIAKPIETELMREPDLENSTQEDTYSEEDLQSKGSQSEEVISKEEITAKEGLEETITPSTEAATSISAEDDNIVTVTISAAGDVTLGNHQNQDYYYSFRQAYDQAEDENYFFENVKDIFEKDDMTIVNLEGPLTFSENMTEGLTYVMKGDPDYVNLLTAGSVEAVSMGNNHRLDYGEEGSKDTVNVVTEAGITYAFDENIGIYETNGIEIGIVSVNEVYWGAGVEKTLQTGIARLQEEGVDLIIACCHWGTEREYTPEEYQTTLGRKCVDWGADLVIGHHPHVLQGIDQYQGKYIIYSLGNFCFGANRNPEDKDTMIFQQTFTFVNGEKQEEGDIRIIPCSISSISTRNDFKPTVAQGEEALRIIEKVNEMSKDYGVSFAEDGTIQPAK